MKNLKTEIMETLAIFFDVVILNVVFWIVTIASFGFLAISTGFVFAHVIFSCQQKNGVGIIAELKKIFKRDSYYILCNNCIQYLFFVTLCFIAIKLPVFRLLSFVILVLAIPILFNFWYLFLNRKLNFWEYYVSAIQLTLGNLLLSVLIIFSVLLITFIIVYGGQIYLLLFVPIGVIFLFNYLIDKKVSNLEEK